MAYGSKISFPPYDHPAQTDFLAKSALFFIYAKLKKAVQLFNCL